MNTKRFSEALGQIDSKYVAKAIFYDAGRSAKKAHCVKKIIILAAAIAVVLALCGFACFESGLFDVWFQTPSSDPVKTVQSAIEGQLDKEYTISIRIEEITIDEAQTEVIRRQYMGSELAASRGWSDEYIENHLIAVVARYYAEYDHTKTFINDGYTEQYFYLAENIESASWQIIDNTSPST